jgi:hypothetical protein
MKDQLCTLLITFSDGGDPVSFNFFVTLKLNVLCEKLRASHFYDQMNKHEISFKNAYTPQSNFRGTHVIY